MGRPRPVRTTAGLWLGIVPLHLAVNLFADTGASTAFNTALQIDAKYGRQSMRAGLQEEELAPQTHTAPEISPRR